MVKAKFVFLLITEILNSTNKFDHHILNLSGKISNLKNEVDRCERFLRMNDENSVKSHYDRKISEFNKEINKKEELYNNLCLHERKAEHAGQKKQQEHLRILYFERLKLISDRNNLESEYKERIETIKKMKAEYREITRNYENTKNEYNKYKK
ncbi:hypothetical protein EDEG_01672 [Edhazardia aedis USNM 41457]|uniref:Uncharacterized protein n=1 Tax=Edhazardia aedis (strain USNM 41457) TaxID=1003232 RepID=J8ZWH1_EDHAE|nr:hypothetical protein EDEG_01672 [Edhazardia aedis USNM 41457]|eukprot:EJW04038.1 hypothetical protein EDEG_01672 [Edhazardia aedis USNM 41457]